MRAWIVAGVMVLGACSSTAQSAPVTTTTIAPSTTAAAASPTTTSPSTTLASTTTTTTPGLTAGPPPCEFATDLVAGSSVSRMMTVAGVEREYLVHLPTDLSRAPMPLVVDFHGAGSDMNEQSFYSGFDPIADRERFVVATPNGQGEFRKAWDFLGQDDLEFARAIVSKLVTEACVDPDRVFAAGISSGSAMTASLACRASDVFHGFGLVAADFYRPALCADATPRPMVIFHGTADGVVPYDGGQVNTEDGFTAQPAEDVARAWADHHGCTAGPSETPIGTEVVRLDWTGCSEPVVFYRIVGGGHTWPGAIFDAFWLGATTKDVDASELMWSTFAAA